MSKIRSLYGATPAEIFQSGLENLDDIEGIVTDVLWKDGSITAGWSNMDVADRTSNRPVGAARGYNASGIP